MKKLTMLFLFFFSLTQYAQSLEDTITVQKAIALALYNNQDLKNHLKIAGINDKDLIDQQIAFKTTEQFVASLIEKVKNKNNLQLSEIRSDLSREVQDLLLDVKTSYYSFAALKLVENIQSQKIEDLSSEITRLREEENATKSKASLALRRKQSELTKAQYDLNQMQESLAMSQEKLFQVLGTRNIILKLSLDAQTSANCQVDLQTLKETALKMRPDLLALKKQVDEIARYGAKMRWWRVIEQDRKETQSLVFQKKEIEITAPMSLVDFKEASRAYFLCQLKQIEHLYESMWYSALLEVEDAYNHFCAAQQNLEKYQNEKPSITHTLAQKDLLLSKALLEHATGYSF
jgi:hypothetical protein